MFHNLIFSDSLEKYKEVWVQILTGEQNLPPQMAESHVILH